MAQTSAIPATKDVTSTEGAWFGVYNKYHFHKNWAYYGEYHYRRRNGFADMGQIYLRFGITYKIVKYLDLTAGFVNPWYWAPDQNDDGLDRVVPQYRLWEQATLATPFKYMEALHQLRVEHRYRRDYEKGSDFELTHRFRYKLTLYIPINRRELKPKTVFLSLYNEIFIQAGKTIVYNHFEDNRAFIGLGYKFTENIQVQAGYMNSFRPRGTPYAYENRNIFRLNFFHQLDFTKEKQPKIMDVPLSIAPH